MFQSIPTTFTLVELPLGSSSWMEPTPSVGSFVTRSTVPWNIAVPPDGIIGVRILADVSVAFHVEQEREKCRGFRWHLYFEIWPEKTFAQVLSLWWNKHLKYGVGEANAVVASTMRAKPLEHVVPLIIRHWRTTLHDTGKKCRGSAASQPLKLG